MRTPTGSAQVEGLHLSERNGGVCDWKKASCLRSIGSLERPPHGTITCFFTTQSQYVVAFSGIPCPAAFLGTLGSEFLPPGKRMPPMERSAYPVFDYANSSCLEAP